MSRYDRTGDDSPPYEAGTAGRDFRATALAVYVLYAVALFTAVPLLIGVVVAYLARGDARGTIWHDHFTWAIRTFWVALILGVIFAILSTPLTLWIGLPLGGLLWLWTAYRVIRGLLAANDRRAPA